MRALKFITGPVVYNPSYNSNWSPQVFTKNEFRNTEGPCLMRLLGLEKSRISQISLLQFALCEFWAIYFISAIFLAIFCPKNRTNEMILIKVFSIVLK